MFAWVPSSVKGKRPVLRLGFARLLAVWAVWAFLGAAVGLGRGLGLSGRSLSRVLLGFPYSFL